MITHRPPRTDGHEPLIDVHAHFHTPFTNRGDWERYNASRLAAGTRIGVRTHVASVLGSWGHTSPTYFSSPDDQTRANAWMLAFAQESGHAVRAYVAVNPNFTAHALSEIERGMADGAIGIKLAAGRRADDLLLDDIASAAAQYGVPILHHVWQHRRRDWPNQDASDGLDLARLAGTSSAGDVPAGAHRRRRRLGAHLSGGARPAEHRHGLVRKRHRSRHDRRSASRASAPSACCGRPTSRCARGSRSCARSSTRVRARVTSPRCAGATQCGSFRPVRSAMCDATCGRPRHGHERSHAGRRSAFR